jgi:hypothetical protein
MSSLSTHHKVALLAAAATSGIALFDAITMATTGHFSVFADDSGHVPAQVAGSLVHGATYAALVWVLGSEARRFSGYGRVVRGARMVLTVALGILAVGFLVVAPLFAAVGLELDGVAGTVWGVIASVAFFGMVLAAIVIGLAVLRRNTLGLGGSVLRLLLPVAVVTVLLGVLGSPWAHPGYVETVINVGLALVGAGSALAITVRHEPARAGA